LLPRVLTRDLAQFAPDIASTRRLLARLQSGDASFALELWRRAAGDEFEPGGVSQDLADVREIEKVHAHARRRGRRIATDLYAKLSRIAVDERDRSLRIRFSFGAERLQDWVRDSRRAPHADRFAEAVFPECRAITGNARLLALVEDLVGRRVRLSERIVYANAPGGGAAFHHDAEPGQLGVLYGQLAGATAWLALPKRELASAVAALADSPALRRRAGTAAKALRALDDHDQDELHALLNESPRLTQHLVASGALHVLRAGDVLLLPSLGPDDAAWHSVFAIGKVPSLAHSYGIFPRRRRAAR
jgi:hypothetical protein